MFLHCFSLKDLTIPSDVSLSETAFSFCDLQKISIPFDLNFEKNTTRVIKCEELEVIYNNEIRSFRNIARLGQGVTGIIVHADDMVYFPDFDGNLIECPFSDLFKHVLDRKRRVEPSNFVLAFELYNWNKQKFVPKLEVVRRMNAKEIHLFSKDNNHKNWLKILVAFFGKSNLIFFEEKHLSLFKLAHALGVFSENSKQSKIATDYLIEKIAPHYFHKDLHLLFKGFDSKNIEYSQEFANFFMKYFNANIIKTCDRKANFYDGLSEEHRILVENYEMEVFPDGNNDLKLNFFALCHNYFDKILSFNSNKRVKSRLKKEMITPLVAISSIQKVAYQKVHPDAKNLSAICCLYGISQNQYSQIEEWFLLGNSPERRKIVKAMADKEKRGFTYEFIAENNPFSAVLGYASNCCQVIGGVGESCLEHGMSNENSCFIVVNLDGRLFGQMWTWYDSFNKQVTFDNIEIPTVLEVLLDDGMENELFSCLERLSMSIFETMNAEGYEVKRVTMGIGHNILISRLDRKYFTIKEPKLLSGYKGYTDAEKQVLLVDETGLVVRKEKLNHLKQDNYLKST